MPCLEGATEIELHHPYIRRGHQGDNLVELLGTIAAARDTADEVALALFTVLDDNPDRQPKQLRMLNGIVRGAAQQGIKVHVSKGTVGRHRRLRTERGWRVNPGRGLSILQRFDGCQFDLGTSRQEFRQVSGFGVTHIREEA